MSSHWTKLDSLAFGTLFVCVISIGLLLFFWITVIMLVILGASIVLIWRFRDRLIEEVPA